MTTYVKLLTPISDKMERTLFKIAALADGCGLSILLCGATARDILFSHMHGIESVRMTMDADISVQLQDWDTYDEFRKRMLRVGFANSHEGHDEKFTDEETGQEVDLLPFGEIAEDGKTIVWPKDNSEWSIIGFQEAFEHALMLPVNGDENRTIAVPFISVPALVLLKMVALHDRPLARHKKDAADIGFVIRHYLDIGNRDRLKTPPDDDIMSSVDGDADLASAVLLGRDIRAMTTTDSCDYLRTLLDVDTESQSRCYLARGLMGGLCKGDFSRAKAVLKCVRTGLDYDGPITINA